jgi:nucleotide-binding universal stress UspA family protein
MSDTRPILLATDGSPSAAEAQREALELAHVLGAPLVAISVAHVTLPAVGYTGYGYSNVVAELTEAEHTRVERLLTELAEMADAYGVTWSTVAVDGVAVDEICRAAKEHDAQLIVVGSHGWGATKRLLSGSVSTGLVHTAPCPVLVVRGTHHAFDQPAAA